MPGMWHDHFMGSFNGWQCQGLGRSESWWLHAMYHLFVLRSLVPDLCNKRPLDSYENDGRADIGIFSELAFGYYGRLGTTPFTNMIAGRKNQCHGLDGIY
tara:strand:+ start:201 stop:500 length:300 start_codon:yes stop_codon:yes gene_type:complete